MARKIYIFKPPTKTHLRNLLTTYRQALRNKDTATGHQLYLAYFAEKALPQLERLVSAGKFDALPEFPNV